MAGGAAPSRRRPGWNGWQWTGWVLAVVASFGTSLIVSFFVVFGDSSTCGETPTASDRVHGLEHLGIAAVTISLAWTAALASRRWGRLALGVAIGLAPLALTALTHLHVSDWTGGFCF